MKPAAEFVGRSEVAQPMTNRSALFAQAPRPQTIHEPSGPVRLSRLAVNALDRNRHGLLFGIVLLVRVLRSISALGGDLGVHRPAIRHKTAVMLLLLVAA